VGMMLGTVAKSAYITSAGAQVGDVILLTKGIAVEGTSLIAREKRPELLARGYEPAELDAAARLLFDPGICVLAEAQIACRAGEVHAMHDPTEGGVATGLWELAIASEVGLQIWEDELPVLPLCRKLCATYGLDPLGLIASGSLLVAVAAADAEQVIARCREAGIDCTAIGRVTSRQEGVVLKTAAGTKELPRYDQDELTKLF